MTLVRSRFSRLAVAAALAAALVLGFTSAASARGGFGHHGRSDRVMLTLSAEEWVETGTARLVVAVDSAMSGEEAAPARARVRESLGKLVPGAEWHITTFSRSRDSAGLERWHLEAEARVPETALDGLHGRAEELSRPGEQIGVSEIDFTPTVLEREAVTASLRARIYADARDEAERLNEALPDQDFRVHRVRFEGAGPVPMRRGEGAKAMAETRMMAAPAPSPGAPFGVAEKLRLSATVVLIARPAFADNGEDENEDE